jgi:hypothetical protein
MRTRLTKRGRTLVTVMFRIVFPRGVIALLLVYLDIRYGDWTASSPGNPAFLDTPRLAPPAQTVFQPTHIFVATPVSTPPAYVTPTLGSTLTPTPRSIITPTPRATVTPTTQPHHGLVYNQTSGFAPNQRTQQTGFVYPTNFQSGYQPNSHK